MAAKTRETEGCGKVGRCIHDGHKWLEMCDVHRAEHDATHRRWAREHRLGFGCSDGADPVAERHAAGDSVLVTKDVADRQPRKSPDPVQESDSPEARPPPNKGGSFGFG